MVCLGRSYHFNFFKGCLPQILLDPFLNTLNQMVVLPNILLNLGKAPFKLIKLIHGKYG